MKRKLIALLLMLLLTLLCSSALAQTLSLDAIHATCNVPDDYILLLPTNLHLHEEWVQSHGGSEEALLADWSERGVLAQAWDKSGETCLEFTALQDTIARQLYDVDQQETAARTAYRTNVAKGESWKQAGYTVQSAEWKKYATIGRFLMIKYKRALPRETYRGVARLTVRNGYSIMADLKVFGRNVSSADQRVLDKVMDSWVFTSILNKPIDVIGEIFFSEEPPTETNTGKFTVSGTCDPGLRLIAVAMRMSSPDPVRFEGNANSKGKFSIDMALPQEGTWLVSVTAMNGDTEVGDFVFDTTTYQKSLLTVNFDKPLPVGEASIVGDKLVISGTTMKQTTVQCIVSGGISYNKQIKTNNSGKFTFSIDVSAEGDYDMVLTFTKKGYSTRRYTTAANHTITEADLILRAKETAVKPAYSTLTSKLAGYTGRIMKYKLYVTDIQQAGDEWVLFMAMEQKSNGTYKNYVIVTTDEDPNVSIDSVHTVYATCTGPYEVENAEKTVTYPGFKLITIED